MLPAVRVGVIAVTWVAIQIGSGFIAHRIPLSWFQKERFLFRTRRFERGGAFYRRVFRIHRWKRLLPEAGATFSGGFAKRSLAGAGPDYLKRFVAETRRAELTHWLPLLFSLTFFLWNPPEVAVWMPLFALVVNAPFIMVQRNNRPRLQRAAREVAQHFTRPQSP
ncbi:MAG: glycosyl-4,4'-diaponeurosporenoate acyltransferase [Spirochaetaceae bacterium]|nr:MAG: glycosyl-4,4'-diaponeurosporenoate acyltransferase [Spirochaetaceae bacterium]